MVMIMELFVDTNKISEEIKKLDSYIKQYSDNSYETFHELSKLNSYWQGKYYNIFEEKIEKEKNKNLLIVEQLETISNFYKFAESIYQRYDS